MCTFFNFNFQMNNKFTVYNMSHGPYSIERPHITLISSPGSSHDSQG